MASKKPLSPTSIERAERQRVAAEEGARAIAEIERDAAAVRKNMERLRALREAKEEEALRDRMTSGAAAVTKPAKRKKQASK
jgi:hypothetical protein